MTIRETDGNVIILRMSMQKEQQVLISLLDDFIHKTTPQLPDGINWDDVVYLASINSVLGIVSFMISRYHLQKNPEVLEACKSYYERSFRYYSRLFQTAESLIHQLQDNQIDHVLFKGAVLRNLYPVPEFRSFGDVDILIPGEKREKSRKLLAQLGYEESGAWEPVFTYKKGRELYELHTELLETDIPGKPGCRIFFKNPWEHAVQQQEHTFYFDMEYHFLYLISHLAKHMSSYGAGIRMYMDLAAYIMHYGEEMNWDEIRQALIQMDLLAFARTALTAAQRWFREDNPLADDSIAEDYMEQFAEFVLFGGTFGWEDKDRGVLDLSREERQTGSMNRLSVLRKRLFPPASQIAARYTYLQKQPWLLPAAWVHRVIITWGSHNKHTAELKQVFHADVRQARERNELLKKAGL